MTDLIGKSFGRYHILEQLGEGGMATVYKAFDTRLETDVAVKVIRTENILPSALDRALKRFEREAKSLARLTHPNIVKVTDYGENDGKPYLVMPYLPGGTLKQKMGKPVPWQEVIHILMPIAEALDYAHSQNMIHRDVKPSNILLTERGQPMLTDFGIAKVLDSEETMELTGTSAAIGTPEYMAPEQATARMVDHRADIYALGIVLYEMVTGRKPFIADTPMAVLIKHATEALPRPKQYVSNLPDGMEKILLKTLAKQPENRYQDMGELVSALKGMLDGKAVSRKPERDPAAEKAEREKAEKAARDAAEKAKRERSQRRNAQQVAFRDYLSKALASLRSVSPKTKYLFPLAGVIVLIFIFTFFFNKPEEVPIATIPVATQIPMVFSGASGSEVNIYLYDADAKTVSPVVAGGGKNWGPAVSSSGNIYFTSTRDNKAEIYRLIDGKIERVTKTPGNFESWGPAPTASGNIYFTSNREDGKAEIYRLIDGKIERVTRTPGNFESWGPAPAASGNIYFTSNREDGKAEIYRLIDGKIERVTETPGNYESWGPVPSSSGNIYFTSNRGDGKAEVYRLIDGKTESVTNTTGDFESWGPVLRGQDVYFTSNRSLRDEVYKLNSTGTIWDMTSWTNMINEKSPAY